MYIDKLEIVTYGTQYEGNKEKKNAVLNHTSFNDGISLKKLVSFIDAYDDVHDTGKTCKILVEFTEND